MAHTRAGASNVACIARNFACAADESTPAWKQDLARLQQSLPAQQPGSISGLSRNAQDSEPTQSRTAPTVRRRDSLSSLSADKQFSNVAVTAGPTTNGASNQSTASLQPATPRSPVSSGTGFGARKAPRPSQSQSPQDQSSTSSPSPSGATSAQGFQGVAGLAALRENFLPSSGAAQLRQSPFKGGIAGRGPTGPTPQPDPADPTAAGTFQGDSPIPDVRVPSGFGPTGVGRQQVSSRFPGGQSTDPDESGDLEEVISVGLDDWPDDDEDDESGWVDVSKGRRPAASSPAAEDPLADLVFSQDGWSVEDLGSGPPAGGPGVRASAPAAEAEPYAVEVSRTATLPAPASSPLAEEGKHRKNTRRRDAIARVGPIGGHRSVALVVQRASCNNGHQ